MSKQQDNLLFVFAIGIFLLMLHSMNAWFLWNVERIWLEIFTIIIGIVLVIKNKKTYFFSKGSLYLTFLFSLAILWNTKNRSRFCAYAANFFFHNVWLK